MTVISLEHIRFGYPGFPPVLSDVSVRLGKDEILCIIGPSGCGKTSLLNIAGGFTPPEGGRLVFQEMINPQPGRKRIMVFQDSHQLFPWLTVRRNVAFPSLPGEEDSSDRLLRLVGLSESAEMYPSQLSGGMKQRAVIARAMTPRPEILLLDEPFTALDAPTRRELQNMLLDLRLEFSVSMMFVTHDIREAVYLADRLLIMTPGGTREMAISLSRERDEFSDEFVKIEREVYKLISAGRS
ncbi:MAG: ABC transporter ATP-binding protein [Spirochaetales bacterium]|nr:ABC transporter ATP-binding protein [Spirochaetales bacterium]